MLANCKNLFLFVFVLLTSVSNTNKERYKAGAARADMRLQALQHNKRSERDFPSLGKIMISEEFSIEIIPVHQQHRIALTVQQLQRSLAATPEEAGNSHE